MKIRRLPVKKKQKNSYGNKYMTYLQLQLNYSDQRNYVIKQRSKRKDISKAKT